jgi:hypothetical protein
MARVLVGALIGVGALLLAQPYLKRRAQRQLALSAGGHCERCASALDPLDRYVIEGRIVCAMCAEQTRKRATAAVWGLIIIGVAGALFGALGVLATWRREETLSFGPVAGLLGMFPGLILVCLLTVKLFGRYSNRSRLHWESVDAAVVERLATRDLPEPPTPGP